MVTISGVSTLGVTLSYAVEQTKGQKPSSFTQLPRVNAISGIELTTEQIDASALEDLTQRMIAGRQSTGGEWNVTFNLTDETVPLLEAMMQAASTALQSGKRTWFQVDILNLEKSFFVVGQPGTKVPMPEFAQNSLLTGQISITIDEYIGLDTAVAVTDPTGTTS